MKKDKTVLVGILKSPHDLKLLRTEHWYRIPFAHSPIRKFDYIAFYQPAVFGRSGKCIRYYARALGYNLKRRKDLLPSDSKHPRFWQTYLQVRLGKLQELEKPIRNKSPRRISFAFTTYSCLLGSKNILELYNVAPTEEIMDRALKKAGIKHTPQHCITCGKKRFRLDFAVIAGENKIAIECDNKKAHSYRENIDRDRAKDRMLEKNGWLVVRLKEKEIVEDTDKCLEKINKLIKLNFRSPAYRPAQNNSGRINPARIHHKAA